MPSSAPRLGRRPTHGSEESTAPFLEVALSSAVPSSAPRVGRRPPYGSEESTAPFLEFAPTLASLSLFRGRVGERRWTLGGDEMGSRNSAAQEIFLEAARASSIA